MSEENNQPETPFIRLNKEDTQSLIDSLRKKFGSKSIIEYKYKFIKEKSKVLIPLKRKYVNEIANYLEERTSINCNLIYRKAIINPRFKYKTIQDVLKEESRKLPSNLIPNSYDTIGSIAIVEFPHLNNLSNKEILIYKRTIAKAITIVNKSIDSVYEKASQIKGEYRLRKLQLLYGNDNPETIHRENYSIFKVNVKKAYFTPRLVNERRRIANSPINKGELIIDMFAGVGPFSIQIAKKHDVRVYAFDINLDAYMYLKENIGLNHLDSTVFPFNIDIKELLEYDNKLGNSLKGKADRIIMNLPEKSLEFLDVACFLIKESGGIIHNYQFCPKPNPAEIAVERFTKTLTHYKYQIEDIIHGNIVKSYSPTSDLISLDIKIISSQ